MILCLRLSWFTNSEISSLLSKCMHPRLDFSMGDSQTYSNSVVGGSVLVSLPLCWNWFLNLFVMWLEKTLGTSSFLSEIAIQLQFIAQHTHICQQMVIIDHHKITIYRNQLLDMYLHLVNCRKKIFLKEVVFILI